MIKASIKHLLGIAAVAALAACGGGGGSTASTPAAVTCNAQQVLQDGVCVAVENVVTLPTDITKVTYPTSYTQLASAPVVDDTCIVSTSSVQIPANYLGAYPLPTLSGNSLKAFAKLAISPKDNWTDTQAVMNPNMNRACNTDNKTAYLATVKRLKALGASYITVAQYIRLDSASNPTAFVTPNISVADLQWMVANASPLKVRLQMQVARYDVNVGPGDSSDHDAATYAVNSAWWTKFFDLYQPFMTSQASTGIASMSLDFADWSPNWDCAGCNTTKFSRLSKLSSDLHTKYPAMGQSVSGNWLADNSPNAPWGSLLAEAKAFLAAGHVSHIDYMVGPYIPPNDTDYSVSHMKTRIYVPDWVLNSTIPINWVILAPSLASAYTTGWIDDWGCPPGTCAAALATTDFSLQAVTYEAILEYIYEAATQKHTPIDAVTINSYWWTDTVRAHDSFPNISQNIRNKPAEAIVYNWWK